MLDPKVKALRQHYQSIIEMRKAEFQVYLDNPVAVGEHSNLIATMDALLGKIAEADDKLLVLLTHFGEDA